MPFRPLDRRTFLRSAGVAIGLPLLDAMMPTSIARAQSATNAPKRIVLVCRPLGMYAPNFFPEQTGPNYEPSRYLRVLQPQKEHFTVISGMSHRYAAGHYAESASCSPASIPISVRPNDLKNSISIDQENRASRHRQPDQIR